MSTGTYLSSPNAGAAPHPPAGTFSPYRDGEKGDGRSLGALLATLVIGEAGDDSAPLPVTIRGEDAGRQVRGGAGLDNWRSPPQARNRPPPKPTISSAGVARNGA